MFAARRGVENACESAVVRKNDDPISTDVISGLYHNLYHQLDIFNFS